jgi:flagellar basal body-associated protein FliL
VEVKSNENAGFFSEEIELKTEEGNKKREKELKEDIKTVVAKGQHGFSLLIPILSSLISQDIKHTTLTTLYA